MKIADINFSLIQKRAFLKIAMELVKIDNLFHCNEMDIISFLEKECNVQTNDIEMIHYLSMSQAINVLKQLDHAGINEIINVFEKIISSDNNIDTKENILLSSIKMALLPEYSKWVSIISIDDATSDCNQNQLAYIEKVFNRNCHSFFNNDYELLHFKTELKKAGITLFYLPAELNNIKSFWLKINDRNSSALNHSLNFITPPDNYYDSSNILTNLNSIDHIAFYNTLILHYKIIPDLINSNSFLLLKIKNGDILDDNGNIHNYSDFLIISLDENIKQRITDFLSILTKPDLFIPVDGYYKVLYEYINKKSQMLGTVEIDNNFQLFFKNINSERIIVKSHPQSCALYFLLLKYGKLGLSSNTFNNALLFLENLKKDTHNKKNYFNSDSLLCDLLKHNDKESVMLYNLITIYSTLSTKNVNSVDFIDYIIKIIKHRASLKNYINTAFRSLQENNNCNDFKITYDPEYKTYYVKADISLFKTKKTDKSNSIPLTESNLWNRLK